VRTFALSLLAAPLVSAAASAQQPPVPSKDAYTLFNPTPRELMREMSTDRPDTTESPATVDAGHIQVELSFLDFTYDRRSNDRVTTRALAAAPVLVKVGLTNSVDLQIGFDPYTRVRTEDRATGERETVSGFGDTTVRLKVNLFGNDGVESTGGWALAVMPFVTFPTARDGLGADGIEGGVIVPASLELCEGWSLGVMGELDIVRSADDDRYVFDFVHTVTVAHDVSDRAGVFVEYAGFLSLNDDAGYRAYADAGVTYALTPDLQLDCGVRVGLTEASDDFGVFAGMSVRW